uniref:Uncharacterized protein n=1 Tax=Oryza rufipogon TaxID=4529 RepID=A0A0E0QH08_ORYRU
MNNIGPLDVVVTPLPPVPAPSSAATYNQIQRRCGRRQPSHCSLSSTNPPIASLCLAGCTLRQIHHRHGHCYRLLVLFVVVVAISLALMGIRRDAPRVADVMCLGIELDVPHAAERGAVERHHDGQEEKGRSRRRMRGGGKEKAKVWWRQRRR